MFLTLTQATVVLIVMTQALQNVKYLTLNFGKWTVINTAVLIATAFVWDIRLIEGIVGTPSTLGPGADNFITGFVFSGGTSSIYNIAKKTIRAKQELTDIKVAKAAKDV